MFQPNVPPHIPRMANEFLDEKIKEIHGEIPRTIRQIRDELEERVKLKVGTTTVYRRMKKLGLKPYGAPFARGYQVRANDGHQLDSMGEVRVDEFLERHNLEHQVHWRLQGTPCQVDFWLPKLEIGIEYVGVSGHADYERRLAKKRALYEQWEIPVLFIQRGDKLDVTTLHKLIHLAKESRKKRQDRFDKLR